MSSIAWVPINHAGSACLLLKYFIAGNFLLLLHCIYLKDNFMPGIGHKVGRPGHYKYVWVGQYEPSCLNFPSSVLEDKI